MSGYQICVSGASRGTSLAEGKGLAKLAGQVIAKAGHSLLTGATVGIPHEAAKAYKAAGGKMSVGISPAATKIEHVVKYRLPIDEYDTIIYTGLHYVGRDALLITSCDAVISIGGRMGTLHEFAIAIETDTPIGFLQGAGGISAEVTDILQAAGKHRGRSIVFGDDPVLLLKELETILRSDYESHSSLYK